MILVDTNLLVYAHVDSFPQHDAARDWLDARLNGTARVGLCWPALLAFARLLSNPRVFTQPVPLSQGWRQVEQWLDCPPVWVPLPTARHRAGWPADAPHGDQRRAFVLPPTTAAHDWTPKGRFQN